MTTFNLDISGLPRNLSDEAFEEIREIPPPPKSLYLDCRCAFAIEMKQNNLDISAFPTLIVSRFI